MKMASLNILHMYADVLDLYGDRGNIATLKYRTVKRGYEFRLDTCTIGESKRLQDYDLVFIGGGADNEQSIVSGDLLNRRQDFLSAMGSGTQFLLICGAYQLFGTHYIDASGRRLEGLGIGDFYTESDGKSRCIGNVLVEARLGEETIEIIGFENHGGQTKNVSSPLGMVVRGHGNEFTMTPDSAQERRFEGYYKDGVLGTYLHGPLLPKNPQLADFLIRKAMMRRMSEAERKEFHLSSLNDDFEMRAFQTVRERLMN